MAGGLLDKIKSMLDRERTVRLVANDPALTAELLLLFRMILADGEVNEAELGIFKRLCAEAFGLNPDAMDGVYAYLHDFSYETTSAQSIEVFTDMPLERRQQLMDHMIAIAQADEALDPKEMRLLERTADRLGFDLKADDV